MLQLSRRDARRVAVRAQLLHAPRPTDLLGVLRHLSAVQVDLTDRVAPNADLACWSRLGRSYRPEDLDRLVGDGRLVELRGFLRPAEDVALYTAEMTARTSGDGVPGWHEGNVRWLEANAGCRQDILQRLRSDGPLPARALPDTTVVPWRSSGWNNDKNVVLMLDVMEACGDVAVASREGRERQWDLAERVYPPVEAVPLGDAWAERDRRRLAALGIARAKGPACPVEPTDVGQTGEEAVVDGVRGTWRVDTAYLDAPWAPRVALLSPLDRLVLDRRRMGELFGFDYQLEMYKPARQRRWGYFALPVLDGDRLVGKLDATADRRAGVLVVHALHEDEPFSRSRTAAVEREVRSLAGMLGLEVRHDDAPVPNTGMSRR
ncbi:DNA glycosylase AlkZ-like family protein [Ornithinimicrobium pekingense]|uniref:Winged helix-turn-helix domain-containing protein n=1 Tax=Ornithinimicrobium pekingense TaxID=384677 RepID=A0ABQ2F9U8_9MICO|nr:crosslink repair DNA glycosylase YcaQ family protein [Ornithinimicrobium pekingense]GGK75870.1 hypothetical protein GCM10011509_25590 [Ornithinimicrobium pekingense]